MTLREKVRSNQGRLHGFSPSSENITFVSRVWDFAAKKIQSYGAEKQSNCLATDSARLHVAALGEVNKAIDKADPIALFGIATFAFFEVCDGSFGKWQRHLYGALSLLDVHCQSRAELDRLSDDIVGLKEVVANLVWFDTMGTIIRGSGSLIFRDWHREIIEDGFLGMVGCPPDTFELFVTLARDNNEPGSLDHAFQAINQILQLGSESTDKSQASNAWRCTASIAVLTIFGANSSRNCQEALSGAVDRVCAILSKMSTASKFYIHMAAAAYLAGINTTTQQQCDVVRAYWKNCQSTGMSLYLDAHTLCEQRWRLEGLC
ncbi:hypothetical protein N7447_010164 [Penicillium robsamsonii]|uniref:uncharacterized protein n=1 Tax=Penicillium robsamsonii TaxID=1792511 RepID=UPI0025478DB0|nr:uncharacterized protein N7447_010164 [Penicillium robsamsonii]KAJ5813141.1 hypothetical protein N7447_010164 [Penicillium robsamsonii]